MKNKKIKDKQKIIDKIAQRLINRILADNYALLRKDISKYKENQSLAHIVFLLGVLGLITGLTFISSVSLSIVPLLLGGVLVAWSWVMKIRG